jgi:serine/threonine protein kinase
VALPPNVDPILGLSGLSDVARIGEGGFSIVYRAYQRQFDRIVAVKMLTIDAADEPAWQRYQRECAITGRLSGHPNIVHILDSGTTATGRPYLLMDYFERGSLGQLIRTKGPLPLEDVLRLGVKLAGALESAHRAGVLHRDVKPENVLLSRYEPALADFGIAGLAAGSGSSITVRALTPVHAPPELLDGKPASAASDVYSLGSTLYTALAGRAAFTAAEGETILSVHVRILRDDPPPIRRGDVPPEMEEILLVAMAKDASHRLPSAAALGEQLRNLQKRLGLENTEMVVADVAPKVEAEEGKAINEGKTFVRPRGEEPLRPPPEPSSDPPRQRSLLPWLQWGAIGGAGLLALLAFIAVFVIHPSRTHSVRRPTPPPQNMFAPQDVTVTRTSDQEVSLAWKDPNHGTLRQVIDWGSVQGQPTVTAVAPGATTALLGGLEAGAEYCFRVGTVVIPSSPTSTVAWSDQTCAAPAGPLVKKGAVASSNRPTPAPAVALRRWLPFAPRGP